MENERFVRVTMSDLVTIFGRWNEQATEGGWMDQPLDAQGQAEHFMTLAEEHLDRSRE